MDFHLIFESIGVLAGGVLLTLGLTLLSLAIGFTVSVPLGFVRASSNRVLSGAALSYTYAFRGTPLLVQLFLVYYGLGQLEIVRNSIAWPLLREPFWCALLTFSLNSAAYTTELFCGGILAIERLEDNGVDTDDLGLAIGFEFGPGAITRLGMQGSRVRCSTGRSVLASENEQKRCNGVQTAIGQTAYDDGPASVRKLFGSTRRVSNLTYDIALEALAAENNSVAKTARATLYAASSPAIVKAAEVPFRPYARLD